ncbi:hypothetical protein CISG_10018, partial [Coccidioides immitis RMSCC 3703]
MLLRAQFKKIFYMILKAFKISPVYAIKIEAAISPVKNTQSENLALSSLGLAPPVLGFRLNSVQAAVISPPRRPPRLTLTHGAAGIISPYRWPRSINQLSVFISISPFS